MSNPDEENVYKTKPTIAVTPTTISSVTAVYATIRRRDALRARSCASKKFT
jgi:hypothetical protein